MRRLERCGLRSHAGALEQSEFILAAEETKPALLKISVFSVAKHSLANA
jgi:hypothetical protein